MSQCPLCRLPALIVPDTYSVPQEWCLNEWVGTTLTGRYLSLFYFLLETLECALSVQLYI